MSPIQLHAKLTWEEVNSANAADMRRVLRAERERLGIALGSGDGAKITAAQTEAERVARMWGVEV